MLLLWLSLLVPLLDILVQVLQLLLRLGVKEGRVLFLLVSEIKREIVPVVSQQRPHQPGLLGGGAEVVGGEQVVSPLAVLEPTVCALLGTGVGSVEALLGLPHVGGDVAEDDVADSEEESSS